MSVTIRKRKLKYGKTGLYLDTYYTGQRTYETLDLHLTPNEEQNREIVDTAM
jgi:hypothetical protein